MSAAWALALEAKIRAPHVAKARTSRVTIILSAEQRDREQIVLSDSEARL
jgi:hypothetical protein